MNIFSFHIFVRFVMIVNGMVALFISGGLAVHGEWIRSGICLGAAAASFLVAHLCTLFAREAS